MTQKLLTLRRGSCGKSKEGCIVAIVTQLSLDRLGRLHYLCNSWGNGYDNCSGHVVAAILDEDRTIECLSNNDNTSGKKQIEALEEMVALIPNCSLETILVGKSLQYSSSYPINALRNIALQACTTEFVFLLDVDCIPSNDALYNMIGTAERLSSLRKMCTEEAAAIVVPCFEPSSSYIEAPISPTFSCSDALKKVCFSCAGSPNSGLQPFMGDRFNRGHRATDFTRLANIWNERLSSTDNAAHTPRFYPITFEEGFEPYVIVNRLYAPLYDEALTGYGRNKALHLYHLHRMGFSFLVCADACLVHLPHPATVDRGRLLGAPVTADSLVDSGVQYGLLQQIKDIYSCSRSSITTHCSSWAIESRVKNYEVEEAISRKEIVNEFSMEDEHLHPDSWCIRWGLSSSSKKVSKVRVAQRIYPVGSACCWWDSPAVQGYASSLLSKHYESVLESSEETSTNDSGAALQATLTNLCSMHMRYEAPVLHIHRLYLVSTYAANEAVSLPGGSSPAATAASPTVWLVTHLSVDRLDKLRALCRCWRGPLAVVVWLQPTLSKAERAQSIRAIDALVLEVQQQGAKGGLYQCDLKLAKVENQFVQGVFRGKLNPYVMHDSKALGKKYSILPEKRSPLPSSIYPVNALRGAAVDIVIEHVTKHQQGAQRQVDVERDNALVFVVDVDMRPSDLLCQALSSSTMADCAATASGSHPHHHLVQALVKACTEEGKFVVFPALEVINAEKHNTDVSDANMLHHAANNIDKLLHATDSKSLHYKMKDLRHGGQIRAFHAASYLAGHMATDTDTWFENVLHPVSPPVLREVSHQEGWEPYGVLSLRTFLRAGGFNRCFVGWHKDKIDFIKRLSAHGVTFAVCEDISAFVLDWQPHAACKDRVRTRVDHLYLAAMQGLYNRSCRQHLALTERSPDEVYSDSRCSGGKENLCSSQNSENSISDESVLNIDSMSVLHDSDCLLMDFWQTVKTIKVCASSLGKENISLDTKSATYRIAMRPGALSPPMGGISFTMQVLRSTEQTSACTALGVRYRVFFPKEFSWKGGGCLPGVSMRAVAEQGMEYECRGRWNDRGLVSFYVKSEAADWEISVDRRVQMHRDSWHSLEIVVHELGQVSANIDGAPLLRGRCSRGVLSIIGARMCVFCNDIDSSANASSHVALKSVTLSVTEEVESRLSAASVRSIIENDVKVIFAPKETHSLSLSALKEFLSLYPIVAHLVLVIAPPLPQRLADELADILAAHCRSVGGPTVFRYSLHNARPFQNPYEVRNEVVHKLSDIRARYTLHINNDVLSDIHSGPYGSVSESPSHSLQRGQWLEELVRYAEENPEQWAVMPLLLEKNSDRWGLHVWWDQTAVSSASLSAEAVCPASHSEAHQEEFNFSAKFNESFLLAAVSDLPALLRNRLAAKPLLFLEDHIVLAQTDKFPASVPLFDPLACYRREFFDLAWQIRVRGGDVGIALNSVVTYVKVQPLQLDDIAYFVHRRQDELCFMSQRYLSHKWRINYRTDRWHAKQLHEALLGARFCKIDDPLSAVRLVLCMLVAAGASRFALTGCEDSGRKLSRNGQSTVDMETMFKLLPDVFSAAQNEAPEKSLALTFAHEESIGHAYETTCPHSNILAQLRGIDTISSADAVVCVKESVPIKLCARFSFFKISWTEDAAEGGDLAGNIGSRQWKSVCTLYPCLGQLFSLLVRYDSQRSGPKVSRPVQVQCEGWVWLTESGADSGGGGAPSSPIVVAEMLEKICCVLSSQQGVLFGANQVNSFDIFRPVDEADGDDDVEGICSTPAEVLLWQYLPFSATSLESLIGHMGL